MQSVGARSSRCALGIPTQARTWFVSTHISPRKVHRYVHDTNHPSPCGVLARRSNLEGDHQPTATHTATDPDPRDARLAFQHRRGPGPVSTHISFRKVHRYVHDTDHPTPCGILARRSILDMAIASGWVALRVPGIASCLEEANTPARSSFSLSPAGPANAKKRPRLVRSTS